MPDKNNAWEDNSPGKWYVDEGCILCCLCQDLAPSNFAESEEGGHSIVHSQPSNEEELEACENAKEQCPVEAIGNDR